MPRKRKTSADCDLIREYQRNWLRDKLKNDPEYKARHYASKQKRVENGESFIITDGERNAVIVPYNETIKFVEESKVDDDVIRIHTDHEEGS